MGKKFYVWSRAVFAAMGGFMFGFDIGALNGVKDMVGFRQTFNLSYSDGNETAQCEDDVETSAILGIIVATFSIGAIPGVLLGGVFSDWIGRKKSIIVGAFLYGVGGALQTGAVHISMIYLGRLIAGFGTGILFTVVPVYIAELVPKTLRGRLIGATIIYLTGGILLALIINRACRNLRFGWRITLSVTILAGVILTVGSIFLPESPRWLVKKHKYQKAENVLAKVYGAENQVVVQEQLKDIEEAIQGKSTFKSMLKMFLTWKVIHRVLFGIILQIYNRFAGIIVLILPLQFFTSTASDEKAGGRGNKASYVLSTLIATILRYYSVTIFCKIGMAPYTTAIITSAVNMSGAVLNLFIVDTLGRKVLLLLGAIGMMCGMTLAGTLLLVFRLEDGGGSKAVGYIVVAAVCAFAFSYSATINSISWTVNSEIHPLKVRGLAVSMASFAFWVSNVVVAQLTPVMLASALQTFGTFYFLAGVNFVGFFFVLLTLPETKGESLERLDAVFAKPWLERVDLFYYLRCGFPWCWRQRGRKKRYAVGDKPISNGGLAYDLPNSTPTVDHLHHNPGGLTTPVDTKMD